MKINPKSLFKVIIFSLIITSCKKSDPSSTVGVDEGKISYSYKGDNRQYTIIDIKTVVNNDTTSIIIESTNKDSTEYLIIGLENIPNFSEQEYPFVTMPEDGSKMRVYAKMRFGSGSNSSTIPYNIGKINITKYNANVVIEGNYEIIPPEAENDSVKEVIVGEFRASYSLLDPNRIPNLPINPKTMEVSINGLNTLLNASGGKDSTLDEKKYIVNGHLGNDYVVTISFRFFYPEINEVYRIGDTVIVENDPEITADNDTGFIEASYVEKGAIYSAGNKKGSGQVIVTKITSTTVQGMFNFTAYGSDTSKKAVLEKGMFYIKK